MRNFEFVGGTIHDGQQVHRSGFLPAAIPANGFSAPPSAEVRRGLSTESAEALGLIQRGEFTGDVNQALAMIQAEMAELQRGITSGQTAFPVRENLEAPAAQLVPEDTPIRNMLPRIPGAGLAVAWRQLTSLGGGWGSGYDQPGGGTAKQMFYAEAGAPEEHASVYAAKSAPYKLLGVLGSVTGFAMAAGANYMDQLARERTNQLKNLFLNEELALLWGDSTATAKPWGDGSNALAFDGLMSLVATGNGTPSAQVQTSVGALTTAHWDAQLTRLWNQGARGMYAIVNAQEQQSLTKLLQASGSIQRHVVVDQGNATMGFRVVKYVHPVSGQLVDIITSRFQVAGSILFGARELPDGTPAAAVNVLPQVPVQAAPEQPQQIQGYVVTDLARSVTAPDVHPFMVSVYEVLELRSALHFAKSTGVTAA